MSFIKKGLQRKGFPVKFVKFWRTSADDCFWTQAFKVFIKFFEAPQRSLKIKFKLIFILIQLSEMHGAGRVNQHVTIKWNNELPNTY